MDYEKTGKLDYLSNMGDDKSVFSALVVLAVNIAEKEKLNLKSIYPKFITESTSADGYCLPDKGIIVIKVRESYGNGKLKVWKRERFSNEEIIDTLLHELAHLRFANHGKEFKEFYNYLKYQYLAIGLEALNNNL